jgi:hypothetical protein
VAEAVVVHIANHLAHSSPISRARQVSALLRMISNLKLTGNY